MRSRPHLHPTLWSISSPLLQARNQVLHKSLIRSCSAKISLQQNGLSVQISCTSPCNDSTLTLDQAISLPLVIWTPAKHIHGQPNPAPREGLNSIRTESKLFLKLSRLERFAKYFCKRAKRAPWYSSWCKRGPVPSANLPRSLRRNSSQKPRNGAVAASAIVKWSPTANWAVGGMSSWNSASPATNASGAFGAPPQMNNAPASGISLVETTPMKKRARARSTGSFGSRPESGYRSATNSSKTSDSAILADSGDGFSGSDLGLPYTIAGTCRDGHIESQRERSGEKRGRNLTWAAGLTSEANHSGLFLRLISYLVTSALASCNASSTCINPNQHIDPREMANWNHPQRKWGALQNSRKST
jgi:hypothetical protein